MEGGLWGFVQGTESEPEPTASASVKNSYHFRLDKAYSLIALRVKTSLQVRILSTTKPKTAWEILQKRFEFVSITQVICPNRKFYAASSYMDDIIILLNFIFTGLHGYQIMPGLSTDKQRHCLLLLKMGIHVAPTHL